MTAGAAKRARWQRPQAGGKVLCTLCPRYCRVGEGQSGFCFIRYNAGGTLYTSGYGRSTGFCVDPIEKKPLNHFLPGTPVMSFGTAGCNLGCKFCQNWSISKARLDDERSGALSPEDVVAIAEREGCPSLAFTYNDPVIWSEFAVDCAQAARARGIRSVMVTAGYISEEARAEVLPQMDALNVDLKAFSEIFYRKLTLSSLAPVLDTLRWLRRHSSVWFEITTLLIPGQNDSPREIRGLCDFVAGELGEDTPLHFTAFHPDFKLRHIERTPPGTLRRARAIARGRGLRFVYVGNVHDREGQTTWCPGCGEAVIGRDWYRIGPYRMKGDSCASCGTRIPGVFGAELGTWHGGRRPLR